MRVYNVKEVSLVPKRLLVVITFIFLNFADYFLTLWASTNLEGFKELNSIFAGKIDSWQCILFKLGFTSLVAIFIIWASGKYRNHEKGLWRFLYIATILTAIVVLINIYQVVKV